MIFYHVTPTANIPILIEQGIVPSVGDRSLIANEPIPLVYAFFDKKMMEDALTGWLGDCFDDVDLSLISFETGIGFNIVEFEAQFAEIIHSHSFLSIESLD